MMMMMYVCMYVCMYVYIYIYIYIYILLKTEYIISVEQYVAMCLPPSGGVGLVPRQRLNK